MHKFFISGQSRAWYEKRKGNSLDQLRHPRSDAYSAEQVLLNKQHISGGGAYRDCYQRKSDNDNRK